MAFGPVWSRWSRFGSVPIGVLASLLPGLAFAGGELFWNDAAVGDSRVRWCNVASCSPVDFATAVAPGLQGDLVIDPSEGMVYWAVSGSNAGTSKVQRQALSGGSASDIFDLSAVPSSVISSMAIDPVARHVYVANPSSSVRIRRFSIDAPTTPDSFVIFNEAGCLCSPQGLAIDLANGFLYFTDQDNGRIARKALSGATPIEDVVTGLTTPRGIALDAANDRVYFLQSTPNRLSYALLSSPATIVDLVNPLNGLGAAAGSGGSLELDPGEGTLGELYVVLTGDQEIRHCSLDAGCPTPLVLLTSGMHDDRGLALLPSNAVPTLDGRGMLTLVALLAGVAMAFARGWRAGPRSG